ncbi:MAG: site-2 protease family protein, partial [Candidatus Nanohaloarchaea archaeon]
MFELTPRLVFLIVLVGGLAAFLWWDREKIERHYFIFFRRTAHGIDFIDRISRRFPRFWNYYGWAGVVTGFLSVAVAAVLITRTIGKMVVTRSVENGPSLVLPGLVSQNQFQAGVSFVPIEYWVIGVGILMVVHEMSHGIVARAEDFELNSVGWIIVGILPGAFVEPKGENMLPGDEENIDPDTGMWEQGTWKQRLKVLGAGSFANYLTAALFMGLAFGATTAATQPSDVFYMAEQGYPAHDSGMRNGTLVRIDGHRIDSVADLQNASSGIEVNETVPIWTSEGNFTVTATSKEDWEG